MKTAKFLAPVMVSLSLLALTATAQVGTFQLKSLTPETALKAAQAAIDACNKQGFQVAVAVTDRSGVTQVLLRDRFAGPHTVEVS
ncbi:MAG: heme-binding protein, partial [Polaromonas sp.]|nr:heme-binding protein [Polaromonas sp.]MBP7116249.1 heme-binding protein [Polaromonas sp.]